MLYKIKNKSLPYQIWAISVTVCAIYLLFKYFLFELASFDNLINVYLWFSIVLDALFFSINKDEN